MHTEVFQIGDLVRVRQTVELVPLDKRAPSSIPGGIYGEIVDLYQGFVGETLCIVEFHEPYEHLNTMALDAVLLELVFRIPQLG